NRPRPAETQAPRGEYHAGKRGEEMDTTQFATAYALSTSVGLRPFLTLALAALAIHFGFLHPALRFDFLGSDGAAIVLAILAVLEFGADKVPVLDHAMHVVHFATKPIAAAILVGSLVPDGTTPDLTTTGLMALGALNAVGVHGGVAALRGASTATTGGLANPIVSLFEDALAVGGVILAFVAPLAGAALAASLTIAAILLIRSILRTLRSSARSRVATPLG
ncbi:MAG TPA: DUF4126 domain-containing protein, partial [Candidatus Baltobacteraceae bacterium]|nr:DUF4126 domain-containing protein [Candidatus Baltobacteraceae bacterium]